MQAADTIPVSYTMNIYSCIYIYIYSSTVSNAVLLTDVFSLLSFHPIRQQIQLTIETFSSCFFETSPLLNLELKIPQRKSNNMNLNPSK